MRPTVRKEETMPDFMYGPKKAQDQFSNIIMTSQQNKQKVNDSERAVENLFNSLTQRTFRGEL